MKEIARGAEAVLYEDKGRIIKHRLRKTYRIKELDDELRKQRTRKEANLLRKIAIPHPRLIETDDKERIVMEKINGVKLRDVLDEQPILAKKVGELVANMHNNNIIHGDLTTSNMLLVNKKEVVFIDFGLSFQSNKIEDKAVDIHLFRQALESKHHVVQGFAMAAFKQGYKKARQHKEILKRLEQVEKRGRYKKE